MSREHLAALCRLLINSGDMTPMAERRLLAAWDDANRISSIAPEGVTEP